MSYDINNNKDDSNNKRHDHDNDRYGGYRGNPNSNGQMRYKHKDKGNTFDSNGLYSKERGLYDPIAYYRDRSYSGSRDSWNNGRFTSDSDRASYDSRRDSYGGAWYNKNRDHSSADSDYHIYDSRERHGNNRNRHDNPSRSPTRDRDTGRRRGSRESGLGRDIERSEAADRDTASPPKRNIRTDFIIYQGGLLYSDHNPVSGHHAATYIKREGTSLRSRWGVPPVNTSQTTLCSIRSDDLSSSLQSPLPSLSPTTDMSGPSSSSTPETRFHQSSTSQSPPRQSAAMISSAIRFSTAASVTTATTQGGVTNHIQKLQMTTYPAVVQDHRQFQEVQPQAPPQDRRSELVSAAAVAYKALQGVLNDYKQQTGNSTAGISVATLLGKRSIGRPSKVRLENEKTALLGIERAKSEMKELEQMPKQLNGVVGQAKISSTPRRTDIDKAYTLGHTAHLSITSAVTMNTVCHRQNPMQGHHQQKLQPLRAWETIQEQESQRQGLPRRSKPAIQTPPQHLSWKIMAPPANTFPRKVTDRTSQVLHLHGEARIDKDKETRGDEREEGYLGSLALKWKHHKKAGDTPDGQLSPKESTPPQPETCSTPSPIVLKQGAQFINTQRESSHAEEIVQVQPTDGSETSMCSSTNKTTSATFSGSIQSKGSPAKNGLAQDSAASIDHRPSAVKCNSSIPPSKPRRRVTFADLKVDDESGIRELDATAIAEPTTTTGPTLDSDEKESADAIATELSTDMETVNCDEQAPHGIAATQESSQTPASDANSPTASIAHRQTDDEVPRNQAIGNAYF
ncbi:hypothetical protein KI688_006715 [Linnemannia hyalina]|uniref:Uncharacterized protein n=1 Tax=Linnemannia hyalina TaxID=64524 RepID=A0A9P7XM23_9FUNG|nr:hypothetical protein KI688_006715 [Linnemannia hyalina]